MRTAFTVAFFSSAVTASSGCPFDDATPPGAVVFCSAAADCPSALTCDVDAHVCVAPGDDVDGPVVSASFAPSVLREGAVTLVLEGNEPLAVDPAPVLVFLGDLLGEGAPAFAPLGDGGQARLELVASIDSVDGTDQSLPEGFYRLREVSVADAKGNVATSPVNAFFEVDRTAPLLDDVVVSGGAEGVLADQPGLNDVTVTFRASEPVVATVSLGQATSSCTPSESSPLELSCALVIEPLTSGLQEGANLLSVDAVDAAGNAAGTSVTVQVDVAAANVVPGSVSLLVDGSASATFASLRDELVVRFLSDDDLAEPPTGTLSGGEGTTFVVDAAASSGRLWVLRATLDVIALGAPSLRTIDLRLVDDVGHPSASVSLPLPAPHEAGLRVIAVPESPCTIAPRAADGSTCTDFDADGFFGPSLACDPTPLDCDDRDPAVHPTAQEVAGDGVRNDCDDVLADEELDGYFVDPASGDDGAAGTRTAPLRSINEALARALPDRRPVILAAGGGYGVNTTALTMSLYGGRDPTTWQRIEGAFSEINDSGGCGTIMNATGDVVEGIRFRVSLGLNAGGFARDVIVDGCDFAIASRSLLIDVDVPGLRVPPGANGTRVLGHKGISRLGPLQLEATDLVFFRVAIEGKVLLDFDSEAVFVNATLRAVTDDELVECFSCARLSIFHSNLIGDVAADGLFIDPIASTSVALAASQVRLGVGDDVFHMVSPAALTFAENVLDQTSGSIIDIETPLFQLASDGAGLAQVHQCSFPGCEIATANALGDVTLLPDGFGIDENAGASIARDRVFDVTLIGAPTFVAGDVDGTCRGIDSTSGPRELP